MAVNNRIVPIPDDPKVFQLPVTLQDVEVVMLRRLQDAHKAADHTEAGDLTKALDIFREAVQTAKLWYMPIGLAPTTPKETQ